MRGTVFNKNQRRKRKMKKVLAFMLAAAMTIGCLTGCGQKEAEVNDTPASNEAQETEASKEIQKVKWVMFGDTCEDDEKVYAEVNKILNERYGLELEPVVVSGGEYNDRMKLMATSGEDWDLCFTSNWLFNFYENMSMEMFRPLNDLLDSEAGALLKEAIPSDDYCDCATFDGQIYAVPNNQMQFKCMGAFVQKDLADEFGLDVTAVKNIHDLEPFMEWVRDNKEGIWPLRNNFGCSDLKFYLGADYTEEGLGTCPAFDLFVLDSVAVAANDPEHKAISMFDNEYRKEAFRLCNEYYKEGFIRSDIATVTDDTADRAAGRYAVDIGETKPGGAAEQSAAYGEEYYQISFATPYKTPTANAPTMTAMNINSKNPEAAIKMLGVIWTDVEVYNMMVFGLEGEHYTKVGDNRVEPAADTKYSRLASAWSFGDTFNAYVIPGQDDDVWEQTKKMNESAVVSPLTGFVLDTTPIETEMAQISSVRAEYEKQFNYVEDFDAWWAEFETKMEAAGLDKCVEEVNTQIQAWLAEQ